MKTNILLALIAILALGACSKVPITKRRQLNLLPESQINVMGYDAYKEVLSSNKIVKSGAQYDMVQNSGKRIASAVELYLKSKKKSKRIKNYQWEFNLIDDETANAFALPGGKVAFYTGIMNVTKTELGTAVVMGHEIAHAVARHGNERMSQGLLAQLGGIGLSVALSQKPEATKNLFNQAYGLGASLGTLSFSRKNESEADKMGLVFMALAGYDPHEAVDFWSRMRDTGGGAPPEFLSTHPSHETRIKDLNDYMPVAMEFYKASDGDKVPRNPAKKAQKDTKAKSTTPTNSSPSDSKPKPSSKKPKSRKGGG